MLKENKSYTRSIADWMPFFSAFLIFATYTYFSTIPAFNSDDITNVQHARRFFVQGRWATYFLNVILLLNNALPLLSTFIGSILTYFTFDLAARIIRFNRTVSFHAFILLSAISTFYGWLFSFDLYHIAYPAGNFLALLGLYLFIKGKWIPAIIATFIAPAFYPASIELAGTILIARTITFVIQSKGIKDALWEFIKVGAGIILSLGIYIGTLKLGFYLYDVAPSKKIAIEATSFWYRLDELKQLARNYSLPLFPNLPESELETLGTRIFKSCLMILFFLYCFVRLWLQRRYGAAFTVATFNLLLAVAPFSLIFFQATHVPVPGRSLYAFAVIPAFTLVFLLDRLGEKIEEIKGTKQSQRFRLAGCCIGLAILAGNIFHVGKISFGEMLSSQATILETNRIIERIEAVLSEAKDLRKENIPIFLLRRNIAKGKTRLFFVREPYFRFLETRYIGYTKFRIQRSPFEATQEQLLQAATMHGTWPDDNSVFLYGNVIVVILSD